MGRFRKRGGDPDVQLSPTRSSDAMGDRALPPLLGIQVISRMHVRRCEKHAVKPVDSFFGARKHGLNLRCAKRAAEKSFCKATAIK